MRHFRKRITQCCQDLCLLEDNFNEEVALKLMFERVCMYAIAHLIPTPPKNAALSGEWFDLCNRSVIFRGILFPMSVLFGGGMMT